MTMNTHNLDKIAIEYIEQISKETNFVETFSYQGATQDDREVIEYIASRVSEMIGDAAKELTQKHEEEARKRNVFRARLIALLRGLGCVQIYNEQLMEAMYAGCL